MPIFDYKCPKCKFENETMVRCYDEKVDCPNCDSTMVKGVSAPAFRLKGDGFFSTGSCPKSKEGPHISNEIKEMPNAELCTSLGLDADYLD